MAVLKTLIANALKLSFRAYSDTGALASSNLIEDYSITSITINGVTYEQHDITSITDAMMYKVFAGGVGDPGTMTIGGILQVGQQPPRPPAPVNAVVLAPQGRMSISMPDGTTEIFSCDANISKSGEATAQGKAILSSGLEFQLCGEPRFFGAGSAP